MSVPLEQKTPKNSRNSKSLTYPVKQGSSPDCDLSVLEELIIKIDNPSISAADVQFISQCINLHVLVIKGINNITDFSFLKPLTKLVSLKIDQLYIKVLTFTDNCSNLQYLEVEETWANS